jgi:phosphonate transport system substrate-binding protein
MKRLAAGLLRWMPVVACCCFLPLTWVSAVSQYGTRPVYDFGVVPQFEQRKLFTIWRPILDELERRTDLYFHLVGSPKIPAFEKKYMAGVYDFAYMNPYHILKAHDIQGYIPLVRDGGRMLKGILVVRKDSPIERLQDLSGKQIAFPSPNALGASLLMRADLNRLHDIRFVPRYVQTHSSVYLHVATGLSDAGGGVVSTLRAQKPEVQRRLRVLYETRPMSPHPVSAHPRVPLADREAVRQAFLAMAKTPSGAALLEKIPMRQAIAASMDDYSPMSTWGLDAFYVE